MIATGTWRARKHKALAAAAQRTWQNLRRIKKKRLWIQHVKGHSNDKWNDLADHLAADGRLGTQTYRGPRANPDQPRPQYQAGAVTAPSTAEAVD